MTYDKIKSDGTVIEAPRFTYRVLDSVPVIFQLFEWLLVIVAFQYVDERFGFIAAKITWIFLMLSFSIYFGVLMSNVQWRAIGDALAASCDPWERSRHLLVISQFF